MMNNNIATNNSTHTENNTFFSVWVILRGWIAATVLVLICVIAGVALSARSLNDFPYPHPGYTGSNSEAYPDTKDYGGMLNGVDDPPTSSPSWIHSYTHQGMYNNGTHANVFTTATVLTNSDPTLLFTNNDDDDDHNDNGSSNQENNDDDEIKYIAVIGWYAIMIGLVFCVIPTLMTIYQRRIRQAENNARDEMQTNIRVIQNRMNDIEAQQQQQQVQRQNSYHVQEDDNVTTFLTATENHDCTWDYLEGLFAATTTTPAVTPRNSANNDATFIGNNGTHGLVGRRRHVIDDILLEVSAIDFIRGNVEKELAKRRDCRRRLLAALKLYSMKISECHLISISDEEEEEEEEEEEGGDGGKIRLLTTPRRDDIEDGYMKSGTAPMKGNTSYDSKNGESNIVDDIVNVGCDNVNDEVVVNKMESSETDEINVSGDAKINTNNNAKSDTGTAEKEVDTVSNSQQLDEEIGQCLQLVDVVSKSPQLMSLPSTTSRKDSPHVVVNNVNVTDVEDDDDNKYSALLIPCTSTTSSSENSLARTVIPTCAICLVQYKPGNYVTWSSNDECCHAFHRDCILIWLLKKDASNVRSRRNNGGSNDGEDGGYEYLCPCCRGEFVSKTLLKEIVDAETTASSTPTTAI